MDITSGDVVLSTVSKNDDITLFISIIALIISIGVAIVEYYRDIKINRKNLEVDYFNEIYKVHLIRNIPNARKYIRFDKEGHFLDIDNMCNVLKNIRTDSLYYYYNDNKFYNKLKEQAQKLEDFLISNYGKEFFGDEQTDLLKALQDELKEIYRIINDKYIS